MEGEGQAVRLHLLPKHAKATNLSGWLGMRSQCQGAGGPSALTTEGGIVPEAQEDSAQGLLNAWCYWSLDGTTTTYFSRQENRAGEFRQMNAGSPSWVTHTFAPTEASCHPPPWVLDFLPYQL